jgi:SH3-like domain-containing protein
MQGFRMFAALGVMVAMIAALGTRPLAAQDRALPYWASLRYDEVRMRVGPSEEYPIEWVYKRKGLPVKVLRVREGWRLVEDPEGAQGWIASSQLNPARSVLVTGASLAEVRAEASTVSPMRWRAQPGVVASLQRCRDTWCELDIAGRKGWVARDRLWGTEVLPGDQ